MNVGQLISELETYDQSLPVMIMSKHKELVVLSYNDINVVEDVFINNRNHKIGDALVIKDS